MQPTSRALSPNARRLRFGTGNLLLLRLAWWSRWLVDKRSGFDVGLGFGLGWSVVRRRKILERHVWRL